MLVAAGPLDGAVELGAADSIEQALEDQPHLQPCKRCAQAEMRPVAEGQMRIGVAADLERERLAEHVFVAIRRRPPERHLVAGSDVLTAELRVARRGPAV